jgi:hypothetical protein
VKKVIVCLLHVHFGIDKNVVKGHINRYVNSEGMREQ